MLADTTNNSEHLMARVDWRFFFAMVEKWGRGVFIEDNSGRVLLVNQAFCTIFQTTQVPAELVGTSSTTLIDIVSRSVSESATFLERCKKITETREQVQDQKLLLTDKRTFELDHIPVMEGETYIGSIWEFHEATIKLAMEEGLLTRNEELEKMNRMMTDRELRMIELKTEIETLRKQLEEHKTE